ncbi:MAG: HAD family hydrolase [Flavobacteriaceae bacterium]
MSLDKIKVIAFDADDTLWENEPIFKSAIEAFCSLMAPYGAAKQCEQGLYAVQMKNLPLYGYGIKAFTLSLIEAAMALSNHQVSQRTVSEIMDIGQFMLEADNPILPGVKQTLEALTQNYRLVMATKGDLLDQERKLIRSGLEGYFHHIEIMSNKFSSNYKKLVTHLDLAPDAFLMVGNSVKSDVLPVLDIGGHAVHIPFHTTWEHEHAEIPSAHAQFRSLNDISELLPLLGV